MDTNTLNTYCEISSACFHIHIIKTINIKLDVKILHNGGACEHLRFYHDDTLHRVGKFPSMFCYFKIWWSMETKWFEIELPITLNPHTIPS